MQVTTHKQGIHKNLKHPLLMKILPTQPFKHKRTASEHDMILWAFDRGQGSKHHKTGYSSELVNSS